MRTLSADGIETDFQRGQCSQQWLSIARHKVFDALRRGGLGRVVDLFRASKGIPDGLELAGQRGSAYSSAKGAAVTEEHCLILVHHHVRNKPFAVEAFPHMLSDIFQQSILDSRCFGCVAGSSGRKASRPCAGTALRESIKVNHRADQATGFLPQMIEYAFSNRWPRLDSATPVALTSVTYYASTYQCESFGIEVWREKLIYKTLLCLALYVDEQPGQSSCLQLLMRGAATKFVFLPELAQAVVMEPVLQAACIEATELRLTFYAVCH